MSANTQLAIMNEGPPPVHHTLKPHHLQILKIFQTLFIKQNDKYLPHPFLLNAYRVLLTEIAEVKLPATYAQLMELIESGARAADSVTLMVLEEIKRWPKELESPEVLAKFFGGIKEVIPYDDEDETPRFARRSLFGYFIRRCYVSYVKLSFEAFEDLWRDYLLWVDGKLDETKIYIQKDMLSNAYNIFKAQADKKEYAQPDAYALWEQGLANGDELMAADNLRRFFEQHFHEMNDSGMRQHALLNLARMHFLKQQYVACRKLLQEAIATARTNGDKSTLQHCIGLLNRLPPTERGRKPIINELQADLNPMEVLYDVKKLLTVSYNQPMSAAFEKLWEAVTLYDHWADTQRDVVTEAEQWASHAVQSVAWSVHGNTQLAQIEEQIVMAFTEAGGPDNNRLTATLNYAYRIARNGDYQDAVSILLQPSVWSGLNMTDYQVWAVEIWHILVLRASRRGQKAMYDKYLLPKKPDGASGPRSYWFGSPIPFGSQIRDPLYEVMALREVKQAHTAVESLLSAIWHAEFMQRYDLYRVAIVMLADVGLEFGLARWSSRIIDEILPQVISGTDIELRAFACFTRARCSLAAEDKKDIEKAIRYLDIAEQDYTKLEMYVKLEDVLYLKAVIWHNVGEHKITERNVAAKRHKETVSLRRQVEAETAEDWITEIWDLVSDVGSALTAR